MTVVGTTVPHGVDRAFNTGTRMAPELASPLSLDCTKYLHYIVYCLRPFQLHRYCCGAHCSRYQALGPATEKRRVVEETDSASRRPIRTAYDPWHDRRRLAAAHRACSSKPSMPASASSEPINSVQKRRRKIPEALSDRSGLCGGFASPGTGVGLHRLEEPS